MMIDDDEAVLRYLQIFFLQAGRFEVKSLADSRRAVDTIRDFSPELIVLDIDMPEVTGIDVLTHVAELPNRPEVVVLSGVEDVKTAVRAMQLGAYDYLTKPVDADKLLITVDRALERRSLKSEVEQLRGRLNQEGGDSPFARIVTRAPQMLELFRRVEIIAGTDNSVLIWGESGTGKELIAHAIHNLSRRKNTQLIAINAGVFAAELFAAEFFGHTKGAFTGAVAARDGILEKANGGTLFLDEIGELSLPIQVKLLRVLQEGEYSQVGSTENRRVDVRLVTATNKDLRHEMERGNFRTDLFFRLDVCSVYVPPLRDRQGDLPLLAQYFVDKYARIHSRPVKGISEGALAVLADYPFPGNVRELENLINSAVLLETSNEIQRGSLPQGILDAAHTDRPATADPAGRETGPWQQSLEEMARAHIERVLTHTEGNRSAAARILGISRVTLAAKIKQYGLET